MRTALYYALGYAFPAPSEVEITAPAFPGGNCCASMRHDPWQFAWAPTPAEAVARLAFKHPRRREP